MSMMTLTKTRFLAGIWEGLLTDAAEQPKLEAVHLEARLPVVTVTPVPGKDSDWSVRIPIPADLLSDGVHTFLIRDAETGDRLAHFTILVGVELDEDIRAEMDLLRAELDMLKRAFRRHCLETMG
jgi:hypothetical protein